MIRLSEKITANIRTRIINGGYKKGDRLPSELKLAGEYEVSRPVLREAMRNLESIGLVTIKKGPKGGIFVSKTYHKPVHSVLKGLMDGKQVSEDNIFDIYLLLGTHAAGQAAIYADKEDFIYLKSLVEPPGRPPLDARWWLSNRSKFQIGLAKASKNQALEIFLNGMILLLGKYFFDFHDADYELKSLKNCRNIVACIEDRDPESAQALMINSIIAMKNYLHRTR